MPNSAGGFAWAVDDWTRLDRFLVLGSEGNTYYASEQKISRENAEAVIRCIKSDGVRVVDRIVEISDKGRAYKNDPALFALALAFTEGEAKTKTSATEQFRKVVRIGTHLFTFLEYVNAMRGWGRSLRHAVASWYESQDVKDLAYQIVKYQQRNGWAHRDALRLSHPKTKDEMRNWLYRYAVGKVTEGFEAGPAVIAATELMKTADARQTAALIREHNLPREVVKTELLNKPEVWEALLERMPMTAMIRNLATLTRAEVIKPMAKWTGEIAKRVQDAGALKKARIHPIQLLAAMLTYSQGHGERGKNSWSPVSAITDALDQAFYLSFDAVEPTGKRILLALDVSGSMGSGVVGGVPGLTPRKASAALALVMAATEENHAFVAFTNGSGRSMHSAAGYGAGISTLDISPRQRLDDVVCEVSRLPFGGTDCALPMVWALKQKLAIDAFVILTDAETWAGDIHPVQALQKYRVQMQIPAKLIVVGMVSNGFTIADPQDGGMLDVVGFSTDTPAVMGDFIRG